MSEFAFEWVKGDKCAAFTVPSGTALKSKLFKLTEEYPNEVKIDIKNVDGSIFGHIPISFIKINPPRKVSDEQKETARERFQKMWQNR